jgi:putative spermidine/putrescine transport system ATP-binding protein
VALARALANKPQVLLLDEPLSALDAKIRISLREEIRELQRALNITTVFVTHDQEEALSISDRIVVLNEGRVEQTGTPSAIYNFPRTRFVASFIGTLSQLAGEVVDTAQGQIRVGEQLLVTSNPLDDLKNGQPCTLAIRPEAITLNAAAHGKNTVQCVVDDVGFLGSIVRIRTHLGAQALSMDLFNDPNQKLPVRGDTVALSFAYENLLVLA